MRLNKLYFSEIMLSILGISLYFVNAQLKHCVHNVKSYSIFKYVIMHRFHYYVGNFENSYGSALHFSAFV